MQPYAKQFYKSGAWQRCRNAYMKKVSGLCERCLAKGLYEPAEIVHHKIHLTPENIVNPEIALSFENLEALCRNCHGEEHGKEKRYAIDEYGRVTIKK